MRQIGVSPVVKKDGLAKFQQSGWVLVDATYEAVNSYTGLKRNSVIDRDYSLLVADLETLTPSHSAPLVLIKANVCRLLEAKLVKDGFSVLNQGTVVYFPSNGRQRQFREQFSAVTRRPKFDNALRGRSSWFAKP